jgi:hypothetical protein
VGLLASELERRGFATLSLLLLHRAARDAPPPRALRVPFAHGCALGAPDDPTEQRRVLAAALDLLGDTSLAPPVGRDYPVLG